MAKEIIMPKFGFTQEESEILEWLKQDGDKVDKGDPIAVVSTDKISMEVEAPEAGIIGGIRYKVGDIVPVTRIIAYVLQPGEKAPETDTAAPAPQAEAPAAPVVEEKAAQPAAAASSSAFSISPVAQRLADDLNIDVSQISGTGRDGQVTKKDVEDFAAALKAGAGKINATPAARRIAQEKGVKLQPLNGSGPSGRIQAADVSSARVSAPAAQPAMAAAPGMGAIPGLTVLKEIPLVGMRRTIAQNMQRSMQQAPHMFLQVDVEMDAAEGLRKLANQNKVADAPKISVTALIVKAVAWALKQNPIINSQYTDEKIIEYADINIGIATALDNGLIVPVIHNADSKDLLEISLELGDLAQRARSNKLQPDDLAGGTFTISNLGMFGIDRFTAIINPPQSAILAVGKMNKVFVPDENDQPVLQRQVAFTLSADHRVMDGSQAAKFLTDLKDSLLNLGEILK
ncbi:2-oxo acid dehydrogenase subunit E2 [Pelolinea submarina]|uniref:Dihydrolipoamide acetyltransferase component of pyruvate dehydrogenase complex n=1 Tax=Pelolinea submarina TaxID=913107 RepID=A0A347ZS69_9CHLR|nr:2-oxo acid dehydrogenase subunit E2 [Pelolinea submarina]REG11285.1 pyruvate dehydrogenase E2 component (dihydrolipoamide acetyltransferase) [Pelolinea submarina]BBB48150.1 pyruvate dehydrogenase E2 component, dihydrolipoamide acetyltransferase [Pelolinea submarina]